MSHFQDRAEGWKSNYTPKLASKNTQRMFAPIFLHSGQSLNSALTRDISPSAPGGSQHYGRPDNGGHSPCGSLLQSRWWMGVKRVKSSLHFKSQKLKAISELSSKSELDLTQLWLFIPPEGVALPSTFFTREMSFVLCQREKRSGRKELLCV